MSNPRVLLKAKRAAPFFGMHPWVYVGAIEAVSGAPICQPGIKDNNTPGTCSVPLILGSPDCPSPPPPL